MQQQTDSKGGDLGQALNWFLLICRALASTVEVFLHMSSTFGCRYLGGQTAIGLLVIFFWPLGWRDEDPRPMVCFLIAVLIMCACAATGIRWRRARGLKEPHSRYSGTPRPLFKRSVIPERTMKRIVEPVMVGLAGCAVAQFSPSLSWYLLFAALGLAISVSESDFMARRRAMDVNDALMEQRDMSERARAFRQRR